jgi:hypothetical protein
MENFDPKELPKRALKQIRSLCHGNGAESDAIQIKASKGKMINCQAITNITLDSDIQHEQKKGRHQVGQLVESADHAQKAANEIIENALKNPETRKKIANDLMQRNDQGFALHHKIIDADQFNQSFCYHEACGNCQGQGKATCQNCQGRRQERCAKCHGVSMIQCPQCQGRGKTLGPNNEQVNCNRCGARQQIGCPLCQRTGQVACRNCRGSGTSKCSSCNGSAFFTHITHLIVKIKTLFEIVRNEHPPIITSTLEQKGTKLAEKKHIEIKAGQVKQDDGGLAIQYNTKFPYGEMDVDINGQSTKIKILGYKGKIIETPDFLDYLLGRKIDSLAEIARTGNSTHTNLQKLSRIRFIGHALVLTLLHPRKKAMIELKKKFPIGASKNLIQNAVLDAKKATAKITQKTRLMGIAIGACITFAMNIVYLLINLRPFLSTIIQNPLMMMALDLAFIIFGGFIGAKISAYMAKRPLQKALGHLITPALKKKIRTSNALDQSISYGISALLFFFIALIAGENAPQWLPF